jgi:predicted DCC family thiol-disulfide oxidoreductase YuxK
MADNHPIILYDGVCGLCNRLVQFVLKRDRADVFRFAALQSEFAAQVLTRHGANPQDLDTMYTVLNYGGPGETLPARSDAVLAVLERLGGMWSALAGVARIFPLRIRNFFYHLVAGTRYRIFGKYDACPLPTPDQRAKFLDQ